MTGIAVLAALLLIGCAAIEINRQRFRWAGFYFFAAIFAAAFIGN